MTSSILLQCSSVPFCETYLSNEEFFHNNLDPNPDVSTSKWGRFDYMIYDISYIKIKLSTKRPRDNIEPICYLLCMVKVGDRFTYVTFTYIDNSYYLDDKKLNMREFIRDICIRGINYSSLCYSALGG